MRRHRVTLYSISFKLGTQTCPFCASLSLKSLFIYKQVGSTTVVAFGLESSRMKFYLRNCIKLSVEFDVTKTL
ncbi:hypothetical protein L6452_13698 [Arctium lappa]|uniref:Uncharacterized protein n=1 Tax=Arctium lappa TaxID=4217 RepID=A0ACB9CJ04_ARCLA|nr:hypothetical protein L6452_13698 [Arctium lappa]